MEILMKLKDLMMEEIERILDKDYFSTNDLDLAYKMVDVIKDIGEIDAMGICREKHTKKDMDRDDLIERLGAMMGSATVSQEEKNTIQRALKMMT